MESSASIGADRFNSMDVDTARDFRKAGLSMARDETVRAVIVRGEGACSAAAPI
ncbi:MAG: hypothetical protein U0V87_14905 [Acidobacteriota bacterium]